MQAMHNYVQDVIQLRKRRRDREAQDSPLTTHLTVPVARDPDAGKLISLANFCGLQIKVETYNAAKGQIKCKFCQHTQHKHRYSGYALRLVACVDAHPSGNSVTPKQQPAR